MKQHRATFVLAALGLAILMAGCWGSDKSTSLEVGGGGASPIATATAVGIDKCNNCHANTAVNGTRIFESWAAGRHGNLDNSFDAWDNLVEMQARWWHGLRPGYDPAEVVECGVCHDPTGDSLMLSLFAGPGSGTTPRFVVGCEGCHGGGSLHFGIGPIGGPKLGVYARAATAGQSSQYNTCLGCHADPNTFAEPIPEIHAGTHRKIADTHFDNGARAQATPIQGYVIRKATNTSCTDCHQPHGVGLAEARQWKKSGHGDFNSLAWFEDPWKDQTSTSYCKRCHTTTSYIIYTDNQDVAYNAPIHNATFAANSVVDNMSEMLYCRACHTVGTNTGFTVARRVPQNARIPGAWDNGEIVYSGTAHLNSYTTIPDMGDSKLCMNCHSSRPGRNGFFVRPYILSQTGGVTIDNIVFGGPTPHYLVAVQTLFQDNTKKIGGYALAGRDYTNDADFAHDLVGGSTSGPCVGCHMSAPNDPADATIGKHSFLPVKKDAGGNITAITAPAKCAECHGVGSVPAMSVASINASKALFDARLAELRAAFEFNGIYPNDAASQFYSTAAGAATDNNSLRIKNWQTRAAAIPTGIDGVDLFGIAYNYAYMRGEVREPGHYVHNNKYGGRLIYDAIAALNRTPSAANFPAGRP